MVALNSASQSKQRFNLTGILPRLLTLYFFLQYVFFVVSIQYGLSLELLNFPIFAAALLYVFKMRELERVTNDSGTIMLVSIYSSFLCAVLSFTTLFAENPDYSLPRVLATCWFLWVMIIVFCYVYRQTEEKKEWSLPISKSLIWVMLIAIAGDRFMPGWREGVVPLRLGGGMNPNGIAFIALFSNFWYAYRVLVDGKWTRLYKFGWLLSLVVMCWSFSRSALFSFALLYIGYATCLLLTGIAKVKIKTVFQFTGLAMVVYFAYSRLQNTPWIQYIIFRFSSSDNYDSRASAWAVMTEYFYQHIWVGGLGWWNTSSLLVAEKTSADAAETAHSLYFRLLAETGILGFTAVLLLPLAIFSLLLLSAFARKGDQFERKKKLLIACMILSLFVGQAFEDRYLTRFGGFNSGVVVWVLSMGIMNLVKKRTQQHD